MGESRYLVSELTGAAIKGLGKNNREKPNCVFVVVEREELVERYKQATQRSSKR